MNQLEMALGREATKEELYVLTQLKRSIDKRSNLFDPTTFGEEEKKALETLKEKRIIYESNDQIQISRLMYREVAQLRRKELIKKLRNEQRHGAGEMADPEYFEGWHDALELAITLLEEL